MSFSKSGQKRLVIIGGPTATGKTALAVRLAREVGGEIVSADARQIYRGMDIGTGKDLPVNLKFKIENLKFDSRNDFTGGYYMVEGIRIWLYDVVAPDQYFSAADYRRTAWPVVADIWRRGRLPLVVGGAGFYIKSLLKGLGSEGIPPDWALRRELDNWTAAQLAAHLKRMDPERWERMNGSDRHNPRRLVRAIEVALGRKEDGSGKLEGGGEKREVEKGNICWVGLSAPHEELYQRIDERVERMVADGLLREVESLVERYGWAAPGLNSIGYRQFRPYFEGRDSLAECVQKVKFATHAYARRQGTWFKREPGVVWFDVSRAGFDEPVLKLVKSFR